VLIALTISILVVLVRNHLTTPYERAALTRAFACGASFQGDKGKYEKK
jgi:hypothetical protein